MAVEGERLASSGRYIGTRFGNVLDIVAGFHYGVCV